MALALHTSGFAQLSGTYTIGGTTPDYPTISAAAAALNSNGVSGPVIFNIRSGTYTEQAVINNVTGASSTNTITIKSETNDANDVLVRFSPGSSNNYILRLNSARYVTIKHISVTTTNATYGRLIEFTSAASYNTVEHCILDGVGTNTNMACIYATSLSGTNNRIADNDIRRGYYGIYWRGVSTAASGLTKDHVIENNTITDAYVYSSYFYYTSNLKVRNNKINAVNSPTTHYGMYAYYNDNAFEISGNEILITGAGTKYGMRLYNNDGTTANQGIIVNNTIAIDCGTSTGYGIYNYTSKYQNFVNNSISVNSTSTTSVAARFYYSAAANSDNNIVNNVFSNVTGSGYTLYLYSVAYNNYWDYNNIHNGTNKLVQLISPATTYSSMAAWRAAYDQDLHSISYDPGFVSTTDLHPDANNPASWSLNGRGLHIQTNNKDIANNTRVELRSQGVPDLGAYEFTPAVAPPAATATPVVGVPGAEQVFTFGENEVATIKWAANATVVPVEVRQYSGEKGAGVAAAASPFGSMYFHTDVTATGTAPEFKMDVEYMDIWLGDITNESGLRMAHKVPSYNWMVYNSTLSTSNATLNNISAPIVNYFGSFTGLEDGSIPSAFLHPQGKTVICIGDGLVLNAEPANGDFYTWLLNGNTIPGASGANVTSYTASQPGNYTVKITYSGKVVESIPVAVSTIAPPNAVVNANGPLTYCTGNGLELNAGNTPGVTYQWKLNGMDIPGATNSTYQVTQAGDYRVLVENIGCASTSVPTSIQAGPLNVYLGNDTSYCEIKNVYAKLDAGYPGAKYLWSTGETTQTIQVKKAGKYTVRVDAGPNCVDDDEIIVNIDPLPKAAGISFVQNGNTYQFFPSGPVGATGFLWIFSDGTVTTANNPVKTINGDLYVRMVMFNACGSDTMQLGWPLSVTEVAQESDVVIYPNPAKDVINVQLSGVATISEVTVINNIGAVVSRTEVINAGKHSINTSNLPAGNYMLRVNTTNGVVNKKFSIAR